MPLSKNEIAFALHLNISRDVFERAKIMLTLVQNMSYLNPEEKGKLIFGLISSESVLISDCLRLLQYPTEDMVLFSSHTEFSKSQLIDTISQMGRSDVAFRIPTLLEQITGFAPVEVESTYTPVPMQVPEPPAQHPKPNALKSWEVILCQMDPIAGSYQYTLLQSGHQTRRTLAPAHKKSKSIPELAHLPESWKRDDLNSIVCQIDPYPLKHPDEKSIISDLIRQHGPFEMVFRVSLSCDTPTPNIQETTITVPDAEISIAQYQSIRVRGLSCEHLSRVELEWPESTSLLTLNGQGLRLNNGAITPVKRQLINRHQSVGRATLSVVQVHGPTTTSPILNLNKLAPTKVRLQGNGGVGASISGTADHAYFGSSEDCFLFYHKPIGKPNWDTRLSHHSSSLSIQDGENIFRLADTAINVSRKHRPIQNLTQPMNLNTDHHLQHESTQLGLPLALQLDSIAEIETAITSSKWDIANSANQEVWVQNDGNVHLSIELGDDHKIEIQCQAMRQLEEVLDSSKEIIPHPKIIASCEKTLLKQPEHVQIRIASPDFQRSWNIETRTHRQEWELSRTQEVLVQQDEWMNEGLKSNKKVPMIHQIRLGWERSGWWITDH